MLRIHDTEIIMDGRVMDGRVWLHWGCTRLQIRTATYFRVTCSMAQLEGLPFWKRRVS
jgi:hypothetical protein